MQNQRHTIRTRDTVLRKIYLSLYLKGLCVRGSWRPNRTATYWPPLLWSISVSFSFSRAAQPGAPSAGCWFSLPHLVSNWSGLQTLSRGSRAPFCWVLAFSTASCLWLVWSLNWLNFLWLSYIIVQCPLRLVGVTIALIQPIHGEGYNSDIPWPDAPVIYTGVFPILTARPGRRSIYNIPILLSLINFPSYIYIYIYIYIYA